MIAARERTVVRRGSMPSLPKHVRIQFDPVRQAFAVLSPEKVFWPNEISLDILRRCDGRSEVSRHRSRTLLRNMTRPTTKSQPMSPPSCRNGPTSCW